jgi:plastocyanin
MLMRRVTAAAVLGAAVLALAGCGSDGDEGSTDTTTDTETTETTGGDALSGSVGPGFEISMDQSEVAPGTYTLTVNDQATDHNFHLTGPGVDVMTDVASEGAEEFTVDLEAGTYTFVCDPHSTSMTGTLTVG